MNSRQKSYSFVIVSKQSLPAVPIEKVPARAVFCKEK